MNGISLVICCHNSADRLPTTLDHISRQKFPEGVEWEVLIIDNASTDSTGTIAREKWTKSGLDHKRLRIVVENEIGIGNARYTGIREACYDFICFIDDDNWIDADYSKVAYEFMLHNRDVGACGSLNEVAADHPLPSWFDKFKRCFAVGPQAAEPGDVTEVTGVVWSAGVVLRKSAIDELLHAGFKPMVQGAKGEESLMRSEDYELCLALKLGGWRIWYEPRLRLRHFMPEQRLDWMYLRKLMRGVGASESNLFPYFYAQSDTYHPSKVYWVRLLVKNLISLALKPHKLFQMIFRSLEGDGDVLKLEKSLGLVGPLVRQNIKFDRRIKKIRDSEWVRL